jgi:predicted esterase
MFRQKGRNYKNRLAGQLFLLAVLLAGCAAPGGQAWTDLVQRSRDDGFRPVNFSAPPFLLAGLLKGQPGSSSLVVYLEGDGRGVVRGRVTQDPTPGQPLSYELASADPAPAVLYLARIGQYQPTQTGQEFQPYWSDKRLAEEAVSSADLAIDEAKRRLGARHIHLVGYSGGGGLALLLAQRRTDVASLVTVAGLLDTHWWVREKNYHPLTGSLNPADHAALLAALPQVHFYGSFDPIIPGAMSGHFQSLAPFARFQRVEVQTNHWKNWAEWWPDLLRLHVLPLRAT